MTPDGISRILSQFEAGAITERAECLDVLVAAGDGDAEAIFKGLPPGCAMRSLASSQTQSRTSLASSSPLADLLRTNSIRLMCGVEKRRCGAGSAPCSALHLGALKVDKTKPHAVLAS